MITENNLPHITIITCTCNHKMKFAFQMSDEQIEAVKSGLCVGCTYPGTFGVETKSDKLPTVFFITAVAVFTIAMAVAVITL